MSGLNYGYEAKLFQGPWTTLVKGRCLGAVSRDYDTGIAENIRHTFNILNSQQKLSDAYLTFSEILTEFVLDYVNPNVLIFQRKELYPRVSSIIHASRKIESKIQYVEACAILFETLGKLGMDYRLLSNKEFCLIDSALEALSNITYSTDEEGYELLQAYGNVFLGLSHLGLTDTLKEHRGNLIPAAIIIAQTLDDVWYKGRGAAALFTVLGVIGCSEYIFSDDTNHLETLIRYLDSALENKDHVDAHPNKYLFAIVLLLNTLSVLDKPEYLEYRRNWSETAKALLDSLTPDLKIIFTHYYYSSLSNLGLLKATSTRCVSGINALIADYLKEEDKELSYMGYTYLFDLGYRFECEKVLSLPIAERLVSSISTMYNSKDGSMPENSFYGSAFMRIAYSISALSLQDKTDLLFSSVNESKTTLIESLIDNQLHNWDNTSQGLSTLCHSLIDLSLSMRGVVKEETVLEENLSRLPVFNLRQPVTASQLPRPGKDSVSTHVFFPGMNSRRAYVGLTRDLYFDGSKEVRAVFEDAAKVLNYYKPSGKPDISAFFMENTRFPATVVEKWNYIGVAMTVYNFALYTHLITSSKKLSLHSIGGESYGSIAAAMAAGSLSFEDGIALANHALGFIYESAHEKDIGLWHIVSLRGKNVETVIKAINLKYPGKMDVFRWQSINNDVNEAHLYVETSSFESIKRYAFSTLNNSFSFKEFKNPTNEIVHSPRLKSARLKLNEYMIDNGIEFKDPIFPVLTNNGTGVALTGRDLRKAVLDMTTVPMYTAHSFDAIRHISAGKLDQIIEIGYGQKTRTFIQLHNINTRYVEYFGDKYRLNAIIDELESDSSDSNSDTVISELCEQLTQSTQTSQAGA